jgi:hypothetical protein
MSRKLSKKKPVRHDARTARDTRKRLYLVYSGTAILVVAGLGWALLHELRLQASSTSTLSSSAAGNHLSALSELSSSVDACVGASRPVLLGNRDPLGPSCVNVARSGQRDAMLSVYADDKGGPGSRFAFLHLLDREGCKTAVQDFAWHQEIFAPLLRQEAVANRPAMKLANDLAEKAARFYAAAEKWTSLPEDVAPTRFNRRDDWFGYCMTELDQAVAAEDLPAAKHWAGELASAAFSLADLHRWLAFLYENSLSALEFQSRCKDLFRLVDGRRADYDYLRTLSILPAGILFCNGKGNFFEVERQAERLFSVPDDRLAALYANPNPTPASIWIHPRLRPWFLKLQSALSPENQKTWEEAARTPFEHSYLINILFRTWKADTIDDLSGALRKFDAVYPHATVQELMSVLMYRGHSYGGLEWDDRYQDQLREAADKIPASATDIEAIQSATRWTHALFKGPENYAPTFTLGESLERRKLDCVRATDMIGAIYRNAGRVRFGNVRWCAETTGHSVAAYMGIVNNKRRTLVIDGLTPDAPVETWPDCYFHGHAWPPGLQDNSTPYAVELYVRGIDCYVWAEGYVVRGPNAGQFTTVNIPYIPLRQKTETRKIFNGPYPD